MHKAGFHLHKKFLQSRITCLKKAKQWKKISHLDGWEQDKSVCLSVCLSVAPCNFRTWQWWKLSESTNCFSANYELLKNGHKLNYISNFKFLFPQKNTAFLKPTTFWDMIVLCSKIIPKFLANCSLFLQGRRQKAYSPEINVNICSTAQGHTSHWSTATITYSLRCFHFAYKGRFYLHKTSNPRRQQCQQNRRKNL